MKFLFVCFIFKIIHIIYGIHIGEFTLGLGTVKSLISVITQPVGWFVRCYFLLMLFSYFLNKAFKECTNHDLIVGLVILTFINVYMGFFRHDIINENGYTCSQMIFIYVIGHILKVFSVKDSLSSMRLIAIYILAVAANTLLMIALIPINSESAFLMLGYNNPLVIISSVCVFLLFVKKNFYSKWINIICSGVFGIYLLHQGRPLWNKTLIPFIADTYNSNSLSAFISIMFLFAIIIMVIGSALNIFANFAFDRIWTKCNLIRRSFHN